MERILFRIACITLLICDTYPYAFAQNIYARAEIDSIVTKNHVQMAQYIQNNQLSTSTLPIFFNFGKDSYAEVLSDEQVTRYNLLDFLRNPYVRSQKLPKLYGIDILFLHDFKQLETESNIQYTAKADYYVYWIKAGKLTLKKSDVSLRLYPQYYRYLEKHKFTRGYALRISNIRFYEYAENWDITQLGDMEVCTRPEALSSYNITVFNYPFPTYSNVFEMDRDTYFPNAITWGDVEEKIRHTLIECQYRKVKYYLLSRDGERLNGFVLMSELEEIDTEGNSKEKCAKTTDSDSYLSLDRLKSLIFDLFNRKPGYYRMLVFAVTDLEIVSNTREIGKQEILHIQKGGASTFSNRLSSVVLEDNFEVTALIYEFALSKADGSISVTDARLAGKTHLAKAGVLSNWLD